MAEAYGAKELEERHRRDETERCALLCEQLAAIHKAGAAKVREDGSYFVRALWPPFKRLKVVRPGYEREAQVRDAAVYSLTTIAKCIRAGYDPRTLAKPQPSDAEKDKIVSACYCDLSEEDCKAAGHPVASHWQPCRACTEPMECGSWATCKWHI